MTEAWVDYLTGPWGFAFAFAAGILSFISPCCLPMVPSYVAHLTGTALTLEDGRSDRRETVTHAAAFVLGFTALFTALGASIGYLGYLFGSDDQFAFRDAVPTLQKIGGVALVVMGLNLIGVIRLPFLYRTFSFESMTSRPVAAGAAAGGGTLAIAGGGSPGWYAANYAKSFTMGGTFALAWTPCIGPVLGAILTLSATSADVLQGGYLLLMYSLGLGVPFIITGFAVVPMTRFFRRIRPLMPVVEIVTGAMIIAVGVLIFFDEFTIFNSWFSKIPFIEDFNRI
jgi:cytochrome c-type biogenesis protein